MKRAYVGLSGGVDSSVSAALLREAGHDVTGVFIKIWSPEFLECTWREDRLDALRAAAHLGIPFREIDLSDTYRKVIIEKMVKDYERGVTPNPDVMCNSVIKFGAFFDWALSEGADFVATGHYARCEKEKDLYALKRGKDLSKDQSYFVYELTQKQLPHVAFPIGAMLKSEVRATASQLGLPAAQKPDSQGLCFIGDVSLQEFLSRFISLRKGDVLDKEGNIIGTHDGAALYTLGQRHGFRVHAGPLSTPFFVSDIDTRRNIIVVSDTKTDAMSTTIAVRELSWTQNIPVSPHTAFVQTRYREAPVRALLELKDSVALVTFESPHLSSPGQSAVFYDGDVVIGGGVIEHCE